jgi:hypothetical protein
MASERVVDLALSTRQGGLVCLFVGRFLGEVHARLDLADTLSVPPAELQLQQIATIIGHLTQLTKDWVTCLTDSNLGQSTLDGLSGASRWLRGLSQPLASQVEQATKLVRSIPTLCSMVSRSLSVCGFGGLVADLSLAFCSILTPTTTPLSARPACPPSSTRSKRSLPSSVPSNSTPNPRE